MRDWFQPNFACLFVLFVFVERFAIDERACKRGRGADYNQHPTAFDVYQIFYLVEKVLNHDRGSDVVPVTMYQEHSQEILKPSYSIVTCSDRLSALLSHHTNTNMSLLNHSTVISTISYSQSHWLFL